MLLIVSLVVLLLVVFAAMIYFFRRIMIQNVSLATKHLDEMSMDYNDKEKKLNLEMQEAKDKADEIMKQAQDEAEKLKLEIVRDAEGQRDKIVGQARTQGEEIIQQADKSRQKLLSEQEDLIQKGAVAKACELIDESLPVEFKQIVHSQWFKDLIDNGFGRLKSLRIPENLQEIKVTSAFSLSAEEKKEVSKKIHEVLGRQVPVKEEVDPKLVAGIVIAFGSLILDGSLKNKIQEKAR